MLFIIIKVYFKLNKFKIVFKIFIFKLKDIYKKFVRIAILKEILKNSRVSTKHKYIKKMKREG